MNKDIVVLIPIYNPDLKITNDFLKLLVKSFKNIVFVNDGCSEEYNKFFKDLEKKYPVVTHNVNLGKGRGLKNGINYILNNYPDAKAMVAADCDGQHSIKDIERCGKVAIKNPESLVIGCRNFDGDDVPARSKFGNKITRNILDIFVGKRISDTQTGLRAMSLELAKSLIAIPGERYEYETNVLIETKKKNIDVKEVEIETIYINDNGTSHFNPIKDSIRIYKFFAKYFIGSLFAYVVELLLAYYLLSAPEFFLSTALYLLLAKLVSCVILLLVNKNADTLLVLLSYLASVAAFICFKDLGVWVILVKFIIDFIILIFGLIFSTFKNKKEAI